MALDLAAKIAAFKIANSYNDTDFTIKLGDYTWKVHADLLTKKSGYFRALCNGGFKEATTKTSELQDHNPWDFGRFLQYVYTNAFKGSKESFRCSSLSLQQVMHLGKSQNQGEFEEKDERSDIEVLSAMLHIADYFDVPELRELTATKLVEDATYIDDYIWSEDKKGKFLFEKSAENFPAVFNIVSPFFKDSPAMEKLETRMVEFLIAAKILVHTHKDKLLPILTSRCEGSKLPRDAVQLKLLDEIESCIDGSESFAKKYAKAMEEVVNKALLCQNWYVPKLKSFMPTTYKPYERTF